MASNEQPVAGALTLSPVGQADLTRQDAQGAAVGTLVVAPPVYSDASPTQPLSPQHQFPVSPSQGVYPKPLATHAEVIVNEDLFMDTFYKFHTALKSKPTIPKMGGKDLDVHLLYREVTSRGGLESVIRGRKWKEITLVFKFPRTTTSASYVLRKCYMTLLYHYEQVYKNNITGPLTLPPANFSVSSPSAQAGDSEGGDSIVRRRVKKRRVPPAPAPPAQTFDPAEAIGATVVGSIEGKVEFGYLVTMVVGGETLKGVLYHVPPGNKTPQFASLPGLLNAVNTDLTGPGGEGQTRRKRRRKEEMPKKDPNAPRPNRTGYNFFFAEQRQRLKALHPDKDREISRMIGEAWNALSEEEKRPYQERGVKDKERYKREYRDYREKQKSGYYDNPVNGKGLAEEPGASPEHPNNADRPSEPDLLGAVAVDTLPAVGTLPLVPTTPSDPLGVSGQSSSAPDPVPLVPNQ